MYRLEQITTEYEIDMVFNFIAKYQSNDIEHLSGKELRIEDSDLILYYFVYYLKNTIIGAAYIREGNDLNTFTDKNSSHIYGIAVDLKNRNQGIGKLLIKKIITFLQSKNIGNLIVESRTSAIGFYEKMEFKKIQDIDMTEYKGISLTPLILIINT